MRRFLLIFLALLPLATATACDDSGFFSDPSLQSDTVFLRAPTPGSPDAPSALNGAGPSVVSPERPQSALQWDFALRQNGSTFSFVPVPVSARPQRAGLQRSAAAFASIEEASRRRSEYADSAVVLVEGSAYTYRTRQYVLQGGGQCFNYGKLNVNRLNVAQGTAELAVVVNRNCDDERLADD